MGTTMTTGRRSLLALLQRMTTVEVGARCGVSHATVSRWASGKTTPSLRHREALRIHCGVTWTVDEWTRGRVCKF